MNMHDFIVYANRERRRSNNKWYVLSGTVHARQVVAICKGTYVRCMYVEGATQTAESAMDCTITEYLEFLEVFLGAEAPRGIVYNDAVV